MYDKSNSLQGLQTVSNKRARSVSGRGKTICEVWLIHQTREDYKKSLCAETGKMNQIFNAVFKHNEVSILTFMFALQETKMKAHETNRIIPNSPKMYENVYAIRENPSKKIFYPLCFKLAHLSKISRRVLEASSQVCSNHSVPWSLSVLLQILCFQAIL